MSCAAAAWNLARSLICAAAGVLCLTASSSWAHAVIVEAAPSNGAAVRAAPERVVLRFNVRIERALARASLRSGNAAPVALAPLRGEPAQSDRLIIPLPPLAAGEHEVRYKVLATDGHTSQGVLRFRVLP